MSSSNEGSTSDVRVEGLTKRYGSRNAVDRLDAEVPRGVIAGFVGPNGAGKSTTLRMPLGLVRRASGTGTVLGSSLDDPASYLHRVGGLVEGPAFYPALSGRRNLEVLAALGDHDPSQIPAPLHQVGLESRADDRYRAYSMGMKQRLGIATGKVVLTPDRSISGEYTRSMAGAPAMRSEGD